MLDVSIRLKWFNFRKLIIIKNWHDILIIIFNKICYDQ